MLTSIRAPNSADSRHDQATYRGTFSESRQQQQQQQQQPKKRRFNETSYLYEARLGNSRNKLQLNNESESINNSSASSSGYTSNNGGLNLQHNAYGLVHGRSSAQSASYLNTSKPAQFHAHQLIISDEEMSPRMMVNKNLRQLSANGRQHMSHPHRHHNHLQQYLQQDGRSQTLMAQTSMVPMMIDDDDDDDVDGAVLIDDDIELACDEGDDSNGLIAANEHHDNNNNNNNESNTISAFDPQALYGLRESHDMMRPMVDCIDSSPSSRTTTANGEFHYNKRYQQMLKQVKPATPQNGDSNNNRLALQRRLHHVMANTEQQHQQQQQRHRSIQTDAQTRSLVYNPIANYELANCKQQPNSLVYRQSNLDDTNQFQQQYHSFSYHQPVQQLQLTSFNQHLQYPAYYQHLAAASGAQAAQTDSVLEDRGGGGSSNSGSVVDSSVIINPAPDRKQVVAAVAAAATNKQISSRRNKDIRRMQQGSRQHLSSPADQHQHHSTNSNRNNNNNNSNKSGATSRKQMPVSSGRSNHQTTMPKNGPKALGCCGKMAKVLLFITNILFWVSN